jgi:two-component system response regulator
VYKLGFLNNYGSTTVLVIDDNMDDVCLLQLASRKTNEIISFCSAQDAEEGKAYLKGEKQFSDRRLYPLPGLILLDLSMPHGGFEFLDWFARSPQFNHLKVVVWTGSEDPVAMERARAAGATRVIRKPEHREGLVELIIEISHEMHLEQRAA